MIALSVAKLKMFWPESEIFLSIRPKEKKILFCGKFGSMRTSRSTRKGKKCFFVMSQSLSDHKVLHNIDRIFIEFLSIALRFSRFFRSYFGLQILVLKEFNKTIIPFALVGYEIGYSQLGATRLVGYLPSHIQRALME